MLPRDPSSRHLRCYPPPPPGSHGRRVTTMSRQGRWEYLKAIYPRYRPSGRTEKQRILDEFCRVTGYHRKSALRLPNGPRPPGAPGAPAAAADLRDSGDPGAGRHLAGRRVSLVGPPQSAAPPLAPVGAPPLPAQPGGRGAVAPPESPPDGPTACGLPAAQPDRALRAHEAGGAPEASHSAANRSVGRHRPRLHRDRPGGPLRRLGRREVRALPEPHGHPHHLGGDAGGHW